LEWRDPATAIISSGYREKGYFPEAVTNFLALLGWNDGTDKEIYSLQELVHAFDINRVHKAGAKFDPDKNKWFNHHYLVLQTDEVLAKTFSPFLYKKGIDVDYTTLVKIVHAIKERANFVEEFWDLSDFFFIAPTQYDEKASKNWKAETPILMKQTAELLAQIEDFSSLNIETIVKTWMTASEIAVGKIMQPLRLSIVGTLKGPHLFDIIEIIGKEESVKRIEKAITSL
jgi:glutamyl-tRNA synthetase